MGNDNDEIKRHPSWGVIGASRVSGSGKDFFQSDINTPSFIEITLCTASKCRKWGTDYVSGEKTLFKIKLTPAQWAGFLTNLNVGYGVPCTIKMTESSGYIDFGPEEDKLDLIYEEMNDDVDDILSTIKDLQEQVARLAESKKMQKGAADTLTQKLNRCANKLKYGGDSFIRERAREAIDSMVVQAKANIVAFTEARVHSLGLEALSNQLPKLK